MDESRLRSTIISRLADEPSRVRLGGATARQKVADQAWCAANVVVKNRNHNEGEVTVRARLVSKADGATYFGRKNADLEGHQTLTVTVEIEAPPDEYDVEADVDYPPR